MNRDSLGLHIWDMRGITCLWRGASLDYYDCYNSYSLAEQLDLIEGMSKEHLATDRAHNHLSARKFN